MAHDVFDRTQQESPGAELSAGTYNLIIGLVLLWGFGLNWAMVVMIPVESILALNPLVFFGGYFALALGGVFLFRKSSNPVWSFVGYNMVAVPFGAIVNLAVSRYDPAVVIETIQLTAAVTVVMMILGTLFPQFFARIAGALSIALLIVIVIEVANIFIFKRDVAVIDWIVALIFCGYIGYDWGRANRIPKTVDNAIDSAASLYMDIINLFLRLLRRRR
ncbi:MAG TPA: Bax inhibitor-1 family protein [Opitutaceae bacterium]|nr:Bax inhibitor-1 family protein [Opitutaceae bacterium]